MQQHDYYMRLAIEVARRCPHAPFGTVLVDVESGEIVAEGLNRVDVNPIMHGEMDAIIRYAKHGGSRWNKLRLYTTAEPCCMCVAAIVWSDIPEVVFGTSIPKLIELGWNQLNLRAEQVVASAGFAHCRVVAGILADECDKLFKRANAERMD